MSWEDSDDPFESNTPQSVSIKNDTKLDKSFDNSFNKFTISGTSKEESRESKSTNESNEDNLGGFVKKTFNIAKFKTYLERSPNKSKALGEYLKLYIQYKLEEANDKPEKVYKQINLELPFSMVHLPKGPAVIQWKSWMENIDNIYNDLYKDVFAPFGNKFPRGIKLTTGLAMDKKNTVNRFNMSKTNAVSTSHFHGTLHICLGTIIKPEDTLGKPDY